MPPKLKSRFVLTCIFPPEAIQALIPQLCSLALVLIVQLVQVLLEVLRKCHYRAQMLVGDQDGPFFVLPRIVLCQRDGRLEG